jgi:hypothetical protein
MPQPKKGSVPVPNSDAAITTAPPPATGGVSSPLDGSAATGFSNISSPQNGTNIPIPQNGVTGGPPSIRSGNSNPTGAPQGTYSVPVGYTTGGGGLVMGFENFIPLFLAFAFWFVSLYLWNESARLQRWLIKDEKDGPDPQSGLGVIGSWTIIIVLSAFLLWLGTHPPVPDNAPTPLFFLFSILRYPESYVTVVFMLGVVPAAVAFCKFVLAIPLAQTAARTTDGTNSISRSPMMAFFGAIIGAINLAGSSVTLWVWLSAARAITPH